MFHEDSAGLGLSSSVIHRSDQGVTTEYGGDSSGAISLRDLAKLSCMVVQFIDESKPDVVLACDRGARLFAFAIKHQWLRMNPKRRFPSKDGKIHFLRVSRESSAEMAHASVGYAFQSACLKDPEQAKVLFIDDWIRTGKTVELFRQAAEAHGVADEHLSIATICGTRVRGLHHVIGDETRDPRNSIWNAYEEYNPVVYPAEDVIFPVVVRGTEAQEARTRLAQLIDEQYVVLNEIAA